MIYEVRTYDLQPQSLAEVEKRFGEAYEYRKKVSPLAAFFHTEIGPLNQIIHIWPYKDMAERDRLRAEALKACDGHWPPKTAEFIMAQRTDVFHAFPFSPEIKPGKQGPYFEMRIYTVANHGEMAKMEAMWAAALPDRLKIGPVTAVWKSEMGALNKFLHIWPYKSLNDRVETRNKATAAGVWPPTVVGKKLGLPGAKLVHQENKIVMPSAFSPLQ
jgi:hypothetical protein